MAVNPHLGEEKDENDSKGVKKALIIGISKYDYNNKFSNLDFCENDANEVYSILKNQGYDIPANAMIVGRVEWSKMRDEIIKFFRDRKLKPDDTLFFYFSGHGYLDTNTGLTYLSTSEIDPETPESRAIPFDELTTHLNYSNSERIVAVLDCCYSGALEIGWGKGEEGEREDEESAKAEKGEEIASLAEDHMRKTVKRVIESGRGKCVLASSLEEQRSFKMQDQPYSLFTYFLIQGLKGAEGESVDSNGYVTPELLGSYVNNKIYELPTIKQKPIRRIEAIGQIILAHYPDLAKKQKEQLSSQKDYFFPEFLEKRLKSAEVKNKREADRLAALVDEADRPAALQDEADKTVFISYAREDSAEAERLYRDLKNAGAKPWIDKEEIRAGENWDLALSKAIKNSRYFILLFSSKSVDKKGYVNKELGYALEVLDDYPEKSIFMIPVRLDDCEIPFEKLKKIHNADLFPDWNNGVKRIFKSMGIDIVPKPEPGLEEQWIMGISEYHWNRLLKNIYEKKCIPFIGAGVHRVQNKDGRPFIPLSIVDKLKDKYGYALEELKELAKSYFLEDSNRLAKVAQYIAIEDAEGNEIDPKTLLSEMIKEIDSSKFSFPSETGSPYDILTDLDLPIYITTNYDHFLEDALARSRRIRKQPQSDFFRWSDELIRYSKVAEVSSVFDDAQYKPTEERPLVYHIHGDIKNPQSMVLTEKDYFEFVINTNKEEAQDIPSILRKEIATSSLLFIGYSVEDIDFRTMFQGFLTFLDSMVATRKREPSVAVLLPPQISKKGKAKMQRYLEQYTRNLYPDVRIFWGDTSEFIKELDKRWKEFKQGHGYKNLTS